MSGGVDAGVPQSAQGWHDTGNAQVKAGEFSAAHASYTAAILSSPHDTPPTLLSIRYSNRALCLLKLGRYGETCDDAKFAVKTDPRNVKAMYRWGLAQLELGEFDFSATLFRHAQMMATDGHIEAGLQRALQGAAARSALLHGNVRDLGGGTQCLHGAPPPTTGYHIFLYEESSVITDPRNALAVACLPIARAAGPENIFPTQKVLLSMAVDAMIDKNWTDARNMGLKAIWLEFYGAYGDFFGEAMLVPTHQKNANWATEAFYRVVAIIEQSNKSMMRYFSARLPCGCLR
jgi:tetratricopeptide (TPR) repeat protein